MKQTYESMKTILYYCLTLLLFISVCNDAEAKKKKYPNGDVYEGEWKNGQPEGKGRMIYANGDFYEGNWVNGKRHGEGCFVWIESVHKGEDKKFINAFECKYTGNWKNDKISGNGTLVRNRYLNFSDNENKTLNGTFEGEELEGEGTIEFASKKYVGKWRNLQPHGYGKMTYANGNIYEGEWFMGKLLGSGKMVYSNGEIYEGEWKNDKPEGKGQITYANGNKYECEWKNGEIKLLIHPNVNNILEFFGVRNDNGTMTGEVKYSYANNNYSYTGDLRDYKRHGEGTFCFTPKNCISGMWESDSLVSGSGDFVISGNAVRVTKEKKQPFKFNIKISENNKVVFIKVMNINKEFPNDQLYNILSLEVEKIRENLSQEIQYQTEEKARLEREEKERLEREEKEEKEKKEKQEQEEKEQRRQELIKKYGVKFANAIVEYKIIVGMTKEMVSEVRSSWSSKRKDTTAQGIVEWWDYYGFFGDVNVVFVNGKVTRVSETEK